ncbi:hypothetical protein CD120_09545 [Staphylococcus saprophyticus]|nr:hypothetical protein AST06_08900 [Staphylococcus saprophyticus]OOO71610.1 hypothetical protein B0W56_06635 [Staphylococcus saprophyticus]PNZ69628.1 hypothetical protein CD120_09545 [Staphylococcus saprophyticus]
MNITAIITLTVNDNIILVKVKLLIKLFTLFSYENKLNIAKNINIDTAENKLKIIALFSDSK